MITETQKLLAKHAILLKLEKMDKFEYPLNHPYNNQTIRMERKIVQLKDIIIDLLELL